MDLASCLCVHDDGFFLAHTIRAVKEVGQAVCFVSNRAWNGSDGCWECVVDVARAEGAEVVVGDWPDESLHRRTSLAEMKLRGYKHILIPDGDEVPEPRLLKALTKIAKEDMADVVRVRMDTYWRDAAHVIRPREELAPILMLNAQTCEHEHIREYSGKRVLVLGAEYGVLHHLSYAGPDERIERKISTWGHRHEVGRDWFRRSWRGWEADPTLRDLHPTHPPCYGFVERIEPVEMLKDLPRWRDTTVEKPKRWPNISVVIPLHGGPEEIGQCLESLAKIQDLLHETIVVDDASKDDAPKVVKEFPFARLLRSKKNLGFAATSNRGYAESTGEIILFLNSDTIVPRAGLIRLIECLLESANIGAAGPVSNNVGYYQRINPTYSSPLLPGLSLPTPSGLSNSFIERQVSPLNEVGRETSPMSVRTGRGLPARSVPSIDKEGTDRVETPSGLPESAGGGEGSTLSHLERDVARSEASLRRGEGENSPLDLFAQDLALSQREDQDVEMLVGFALAVRRSVLEEVAENPGEAFDPRFGRGMFEDTDLNFRIARAGYRLRVANRAFVHHWGSRTLNRVIPDPNELLSKNGQLYKAKWQHEVETGYASHLPGFDIGQGLVKFNPARSPEKLVREIARKRKDADISLTMIVRNEEKVLGACLESARPFFNQIVVVDTGSTDKTIEIAKAHGAEVYESPWQDSFAQARNESLKHAKGKWIAWLDADDTLPFASGEAILNAALSGAAEAFVIPVQFLDNGIPRGTSVDHIKLFKNLPGLKWSRRIHEQILSELTSRGIYPARLDAVVHHTHYDASPEGQIRKLERDRHLLSLEYQENPEDPFTLFNLGMTEHHAGNFDVSTEWLLKALSFATPQMTHTRKIYALLACSVRDQGHPEKALEILNQGLGFYPEDPELHYQAAILLRNAGKGEEAVWHLRSYGEDVSDHYSSLDRGLLTYKRWGLLGDTYAEMGLYLDARKWYSVCVEREPWFASAPLGLFDTALHHGDLRTAGIALEAVLAATGPSTDWSMRVCRHAHELGGPEAVVQRLTALLGRFSTSEEPRLTLARVLLDLGHKDLAKPHLKLLSGHGSQLAATLIVNLTE